MEVKCTAVVPGLQKVFKTQRLDVGLMLLCYNRHPLERTVV